MWTQTKIVMIWQLDIRPVGPSKQEPMLGPYHEAPIADSALYGLLESKAIAVAGPGLVQRLQEIAVVSAMPVMLHEILNSGVIEIAVKVGGMNLVTFQLRTRAPLLKWDGFATSGAISV